VKLATPPETVPVPSNVPPFIKLTVPVAAVPVDSDMVAVNVTLVPKLLVAGVTLSAVVVAAVFTVITVVDELEDTYVGSPL
jgi:hypothetical protein